MGINPILRREARALARSPRTVWLMLLYGGLLGALALAFLQSQAQALVYYGHRVGLMAWALLAAAQLHLVALTIPALAAGGVAAERERQTLDLLLVSRITPWRLVWGKLGAALALQGWLLAATLPVYSLLFWFGGLSLPATALTFLVQMALAFLLGALGVLAGAWAPRPVAATVLAYGLAAAVLTLPPLAERAVGSGAPQAEAHAWLRHASPFAAVADTAGLPGSSLNAWLRDAVQPAPGRDGGSQGRGAADSLPTPPALAPVQTPGFWGRVFLDPSVLGQPPYASLLPDRGWNRQAARTPAWLGFPALALVLGSGAMFLAAAAIRRPRVRRAERRRAGHGDQA